MTELEREEFQIYKDFYLSILSMKKAFDELKANLKEEEQDK